MNIQLLLQVKEQILKEPLQFRMENWFSDVSPFFIPNCGTTACIGGWAVAILKQITPREAALENGVTDFSRNAAARYALLLTEAQAERLFYRTSWPDRFRDDYLWARHNQDMTKAAQVAAERIDHFIATNGNE